MSHSFYEVNRGLKGAKGLAKGVRIIKAALTSLTAYLLNVAVGPLGLRRDEREAGSVGGRERYGAIAACAEEES